MESSAAVWIKAHNKVRIRRKGRGGVVKVRFALAEALERRRISQKEFAKWTGFSQPEINRWCRGHAAPDLVNFYLLVKHLPNCDPMELLVEESSDRPDRGAA